MNNKQQRADFSMGPVCPIPIQEYPQVLLAHGGGGKLMHQLIQKMFGPTFANPLLDAGHDGAVFSLEGKRLAFTTDSYVINPIFFPGGDIGSLAVHGTVNDLAMCGARPLYLSVGFILEEGLSMETLWQIVQSMKAAADHCGVQIVTGDTKVVDKGKGDGIFINTSGVGVVAEGVDVRPQRISEGDVIIVSGDLGRHGIAIMAMREGLEFESVIESDSAPVAGPIQDLLQAGVDVHCLRDLTRGGLASATNELAESAGVQIEIDERAIPIRDDVRAACEILGLDPLYIANEGRFVAFVAEKDADRAVEILRRHAVSEQAAVIGQVRSADRPVVVLHSQIGTRRILDMISGEQLPRIC
ncbi:MAG: hydrogenase expression/formation protein HypE [Calditrichaeota bacterium]|nr:hydrogenase expression/formation protein HypE [Calditrichota bacterium]